MAGTALSFSFHLAGEAINKLVKLIGKNESGSLVVSSTVMSSIFLALLNVGMREAVAPTWLASKCAAALSRTF